jgi:hypothetical protein
MQTSFPDHLAVLNFVIPVIWRRGEGLCHSTFTIVSRYVVDVRIIDELERVWKEFAGSIPDEVIFFKFK